jgi:hypothetical protein
MVLHTLRFEVTFRKFIFFVFGGAGIELRSPCMLGKGSTLACIPSPGKLILIYFCVVAGKDSNKSFANEETWFTAGWQTLCISSLLFF